MPWVLTLGKSTQPPEFQMGKWVDWEKKVSPIEKRAAISMIFHGGGKKISSDDAPKSIEVETPVCDLPDIFTSCDGVKIISDRVKSLIETKARDENQTLPIQVTSSTPGTDKRTWYILNILPEKKSIIREKSTVRPHAAYQDTWKVAYIKHRDAGRKLVLNAGALIGSHFWREEGYPGSLFISDELKEDFDKEGIDLYDTWRADIID